ncbi:MAG: PEP-CTERM sorting domain-containing protein [Gemmatimonas sp.]
MKRTGLTALLSLAFAVSLPAQQVIYSNAPSTPLAPNYASLGFQATSTFEWGDHIQFQAGTSRTLADARVVMSNWARRSEYLSTSWDVPNGFTVPITFTIYAVGNGTAPGAVIATRTVDQLIAWRPEANCPTGGTGWLAADNNCYNGFAQNISFDFTGVVVPEEIVFGVAFNTQTWGYSPNGVAGPYNSLNVGAVTNVTTGTRMTPDDTYWANKLGASSNNGVFLRDVGGWAPNGPMVEFRAVTTVVPEPSTYALMIAGLCAIVVMARRRRATVSIA